MFKERRQLPAADVAIFVDGRREHRSAMLSEPDGISVPPPKKEIRNGVRLMIILALP